MSNLINDFIVPKVRMFDRKENLNFENTLIIGASGVGKTYLILNFLKEFDGKVCYIDFEDFRDKNFFEADLYIFENYDFSIEIPEEVVFVTSKYDIELKDFRKIYLKNLDFEEYFSFDKHTSVNIAFNQFLKDGNSAGVIFQEEFFKVKYLQDKIKMMPYNQTILKFLLQNIGQKFSPFQIYEILKKENRVSKDLVYKEIKRLKKDRILFLVDKWKSPNSPKKIFSYDFGYKSVLTNEKNILNILENMVFLELNDITFYSEYLNFYLPESKKGILVIPFVLESQLENRLKKISKKIEIEKIEVITISNEFNFEFKDMIVEVKPFFMWALGE